MIIREELQTLSENGLRNKILIPLLKALGSYGVENFHGPNEKGKDVYFSYKNIFGKNKHCCLFIKKGDIYKRPGKNDIRKMKESIEEAITREFISPIDNKTPIHIEEFYFVCSGKINREARDWISEFIRKRNVPNFDIFDIDNLIDLILNLIKKYNNQMELKYMFSVKTFDSYCKKVVTHIQNKYLIPEDNVFDYSEGKVIGIYE
jgi:hypothetical protein